MIDEQRAAAYAQAQISPRRFAHSLATADEAESLAKAFGADVRKARLAGLLHDVGKGHSCDAARYGVALDEIEAQYPELAHGRIGAAMVRADLGLNDAEILSAIACHTTGKAGMSLLDKILYLADIIEPGRTFLGVEQVRTLAQTDIDAALLAALEQIMAFVRGKGAALHPRSVEAYRYLLDRRKKNSLDYREDVLGAAKQLFMKKAEDVRVLDVSSITILADYFILASGRSDVHVKSLCDDVQKYMAGQGRQQLRIEGYREGRWIVIDYGDVLIHVFHRTEREFYDLERLWMDGDNCKQITDEDFPELRA